MYLVVDIGGTKIRTAQWDGTSLLDIRSHPTPKVSAGDFTAFLTDILKKYDVPDLRGIGVATAGPVDVAEGCIRNPANLGNGDSSWMAYHLADDLHEQMGQPVTLDNDAAMAAYGHFRHVEKSLVHDLVLITVGTGLGVGAIVNGQPARAGQNMHPELGHFIVSDVRDDRQPTPFDNYPTLESYLSGTHFSQRVSHLKSEALSGAAVIELSRQGDSEVLSLWSNYALRMAIAITNLYLAYFPQKIVLMGGFVTEAKPFFFRHMEEHLQGLFQERIKAGMMVPEIEVSGAHVELPLLGAGYRVQAETVKK